MIHKLVDKGNSVVVIYNMDVIKVADYIIDMGPEGGARGGTVVRTGTPEEIIKSKSSITGQISGNGDEYKIGRCYELIFTQKNFYTQKLCRQKKIKYAKRL